MKGINARRAHILSADRTPGGERKRAAGLPSCRSIYRDTTKTAFCQAFGEVLRFRGLSAAGPGCVSSPAFAHIVHERIKHKKGLPMRQAPKCKSATQAVRTSMGRAREGIGYSLSRFDSTKAETFLKVSAFALPTGDMLSPVGKPAAETAGHSFILLSAGAKA